MKAALLAAAVSWKALASGVDYAAIPLDPKPAIGDGLLQVVRVDPGKARLVALTAKDHDGKSRTAGQWCEGETLLAAINLGMFDADGIAHTGFLKVGDQVEASRWTTGYQSVLLVDPRKAGLPSATLQDTAREAAAADFGDYGTAVQNLRLIASPGVDVWKDNGKRWSEAALALDQEGRVLFLFCRSPFTMHELDQLLLSLPLGIVRAMHLEGGPEASLSVRAKDLKLDFAGSYETGFHQDDLNKRQWALPNVLGVEAR